MRYMIRTMRYLISCVIAVCVFCGSATLAQDKKASEKKAPEKLVFASKMGNVNFDHAAHIKRANNDCSTCHEKLFQQSAKAPLNFKANIHKTAETGRTSCGACHN